MNYQRLISGYPALFSNFNAPIRIITDHKRVTSWQKQRRVEFAEQGKPLHWATIGVVLDDPYVLAVRDLVEFLGGDQRGYLRLFNRAYLEGGAAGVVVLPEKAGKFLLLRHFRHATRKWHWEIPRGFGEAGVPVEEKAKEETKEETGGEISELIDLGTFYNNTGLEGNPVNLFMARLSSIGKPEQEEGIQELCWVNLSELERMIANGDINDGFTIAAYSRAKLKGLI